MLRDRTFLIGLAVFALVAGPLIFLLIPKSSGHSSIGGGGYDLSNFVYTLSLLAFTGLWTLVTLVIGLSGREATAKRGYGWAALGAASFVLAVIGFGHHLH